MSDGRFTIDGREIAFRAGQTIMDAAAAASICPVGALMRKRHAYEVPIGQRIYDLNTIAEVALADAAAKAGSHG